ERLRIPEGLRANRRRVLAPAGTRIRGACARAGPAGSGDARPRALLALDGRHRRRALRRRLSRGPKRVPRPRQLGLVTDQASDWMAARMISAASAASAGSASSSGWWLIPSLHGT